MILVNIFMAMLIELNVFSIFTMLSVLILEGNQTKSLPFIYLLILFILSLNL